MSLVDPRVTKQARVLVEHSIKVKRGDRVMISGEFSAKPLMLEIYRLLIKAGAKAVRVDFNSYEFAEIFFRNASKAQIEAFPKVSMDEIKQMDCFIAIKSSSNSRGLSGVDPAKVAARVKVTRPVTDWRVDKTRWVITNFPTDSMAQDADMSLSDYEEFVFSAINDVNWKAKFVEQEKLRKLVDKTKVVRIIAPGTDVTLNITGRKAVNAGGEFNMPDGEVFTSVVENSAEGKIAYTYPAIYMGREFTDVILEFKKGKVIKATASKGEGALNKILDIDRGARFIGELGIGNNFKIAKFTKDILFDEKIGGSVHIALGKGYKETGSKNVSALHWDMICDMRQGGQLWFDKKMVQKNGKWLV